MKLPINVFNAVKKWPASRLVVLAAVLFGCASPPPPLDFNQSHTYTALGATDDVDVSFSGWGVYASLVGNRYLYSDNKNRLREIQYDWFIEGKVMKQKVVWVPSDPRMQYYDSYILRGANPGEIVFLPALWNNPPPWRGLILQDGSVQFAYPHGRQTLQLTTSMPASNEMNELVVDPANGNVMQTINGFNRESPQGQQLLAMLDQQKREKQLRSEQRAQAFNATLNAMNTVAQANHEVYAASNNSTPSSSYTNSYTGTSSNGSTPKASSWVPTQSPPSAPTSTVASSAGTARVEPKRETTPPPFTPSAPNSNCRTVEAPAKTATGFSRSSEQDARAQAMANTKQCKIVGEMNCDMGRRFDDVKDGKPGNTEPFWDCRISYYCGETQKKCEIKPAAASKQ